MMIHPVVVRWNAEGQCACHAELELHAWDDSRRSWQLSLKKNLPRLPQGKSASDQARRRPDAVHQGVCLRHHTSITQCRGAWANPHNVPYATLCQRRVARTGTYAVEVPTCRCSPR